MRRRTRKGPAASADALVDAQASVDTPTHITATRAGARRRSANLRHAEIAADLDAASTPAERRDARARARASFAIADPGVRRALAESYRRTGDHSEAGRWGITESGWSTTREIRDLRRWIVGGYSRGDYVRAALSLRPHAAVPRGVDDLVAPEHLAPRSSPAPVGKRPGEAGFAVAVLAGLVFVAAGAALIVRIMAGGVDLPSALFPYGIAVALPGVVAVTGATLAHLSPRRRDPASPRAAADFATGLARRLADGGERKAATILLRSAITTGADGSDVDGARRTLALLHRAAGHVDASAAWAISIPGFSTAAERHALAERLTRSTSPEDDLRRWAALRFGFAPDGARPLNEDAAAVLLAVGVPPRPPERQSPLNPVLDYLAARALRWSAAFGISLACAYVVAVGLAFAGVDAAPVVARWITAGALVVLAALVATVTWRSWRWNAANASLGSGMATAGILLAAAAAVAVWASLER